jgi:uncharacterized protein (TIGR00730 family)
MKKICVYCASGTKIKPVYFQAAEQLGKIFAEQQIHLIYGAGNMGLMGKIADTMLALGARVTGIIPQFMYDRNWYHPNLSTIIITNTMHERKQWMTDAADAIVVLPGGIGTMEEALEAITWKQLGLFNKPIVILNTEGYYDPLLQALNRAADENFMRDIHKNLWQTVTQPEEVLPAIENAPLLDENICKFAAN